MEVDMRVNGTTAIVTGGSRGLGRGVVNALAMNGVQVTSISRGAKALDTKGGETNIRHCAGDAIDEALAKRLIAELKPRIIILSAGAVPKMMPINTIDWEGFSNSWQVDVRAALVWIQAALAAPLEPGSRVLLVSSGAAIGGSPFSGGYAGAKRMIWLMANYAQKWADRQDLNISFQTIVPCQMVGNTGVGDAGSTAYARDVGIAAEQFLSKFGKPMPPEDFGRYVVEILENDTYNGSRAFGLKGDTGITTLEDAAA
jgi:NAD(P)-dependent dehydrogenase (short-subunit alcohol dehydrogenase family)